jgi:uncharacterized alpha-E superfamily protein
MSSVPHQPIEAVPATAKFYINPSPRPMLSRDADSMYWMSRYIERAEHIARILLVNSSLLTDVGDLAPELQQRMWLGILRIMHIEETPLGNDPLASRVPAHMMFSADNPSSLWNCLTRARENARAIRESISAEMWESMNTLYWTICGEDARTRYEESPDEFYRQVMFGSMLFQGLTDQTLGHDQRWMFTQLAKYFERINVTCRVLEIKYGILNDAEAQLETPLKNIHWMATLRTCCSIEAYRRNYQGDMDPLRVASFLILERHFPRSIRFCVDKAHDAIAAIRSGINIAAVDPAERILGRLTAQLEYAETAEIINEGLPAYLKKIEEAIDDAAMAMQKTYFLH